jgi:hypothetical protein
LGRNKKTRIRIAGLKDVIAKHREKIRKELQKPSPDLELLAKWKKDIAGFEREIAKKTRRLPGRRKG